MFMFIVGCVSSGCKSHLTALNTSGNAANSYHFDMNIVSVVTAFFRPLQVELFVCAKLHLVRLQHVVCVICGS